MQIIKVKIFPWHLQTFDQQVSPVDSVLICSAYFISDLTALFSRTNHKPSVGFLKTIHILYAFVYFKKVPRETFIHNM